MKSSDKTLLEKMMVFIESIGIKVELTSIDIETFLPGLLIEKGRLLVDKSRLKYVGDVLHEAGHIALMPPADRVTLSGSLEGQQDSEATEMMVIAWTYAASLEIGIDPGIVFHPYGYHGGGQHILENFNAGRYFGVPMLQWLGMTETASMTGTKIYPKMKTWIRP